MDMYAKGRSSIADDEEPAETNKKRLAEYVVPDLPPRVIMDLAITCNLRCSMCLVWGSEDENAVDSVKGAMALKEAQRVLQQLESNKPLIHPALWGEPLLAPHFREVVQDAKERGMPVALNTNGLALSDSLLRFIIEVGVDSIMFSVDAVTKETLKTVRGVDKLAKIERAVKRLLDARGEARVPRIGVSFTIQDANRHEEAAFVKRWAHVVDVIRIGHVFNEGRFQDIPEPKKRKPCQALYLTMPIHNDGTVTVCCLDSFRQTNLGNVFEDGVEAVWRGEKFEEIRRLHEEGRFDEVPVCRDCNGWIVYDYEEEVKDGLLIRRSPNYTYYNKIDRLDNWGGTLLGGHSAVADGVTETV